MVSTLLRIQETPPSVFGPSRWFSLGCSWFYQCLKENAQMTTYVSHNQFFPCPAKLLIRIHVPSRCYRTCAVEEVKLSSHSRLISLNFPRPGVLCCVVPRCAILLCAVLRCAALCCAVLRCAALCYAVLSCAELCSAALCFCCAVLLQLNTQILSKRKGHILECFNLHLPYIQRGMRKLNTIRFKAYLQGLGCHATINCY